MKTIENPEDIEFSKMGGTNLIIIVSTFKNGLLEKILFIPRWKQDHGDKVLNLEDIYKQVIKKYGESLILAIVEYPLSGYIFRYEKKWMQVGKMDGYA